MGSGVERGVRSGVECGVVMKRAGSSSREWRVLSGHECGGKWKRRGECSGSWSEVTTRK